MTTLRLPPSGWPLLLLCGVFLLSGLVGHDPWKLDDATHLGVAYEFAVHGDWLRPRIGHDPWFATPPLYHWLAALLGRLGSGWLAFADAARLATALCAALLLWGIGRAARALQDEADSRWGAPLLLLGTLGLLTPIHDAQPAILLLAAQALFILGLLRLPAARAPAALVLALGLAAALLSAGTLALCLMLPLAATCLFLPAWRSRACLPFLFLGLVAGLVLAAFWPLLLARQAPDLLPLLWKAEQLRLTPRLNGDAALDHLELLGWASWPLLPLAGWSLWVNRRQLATPGLLLPLVGTGAALVSAVLWEAPRPLQHLPIYVPLTLLAVSGIARLRRGAANAFDWFGMMTFTLVGGLIWLGGISMVTGEPARVARNFLKAEPGFVGQFRLLPLLAAAALTGLWLWSLLRLPRSPWRSVTHWVAGMTLTWGLLACLWMPWIDYGKTYRPVALSLARALDGSTECVGARNLGDGQKASLRYFIGLAPSQKPDCPWLLTQSTERKEAAPEGWRLVWTGHRPGDKLEKLRLYRRG